MKTKKLIYSALFIAMGVIISRFFTIQTPILKIGFAFIPSMIACMLLGPVFGGIICGSIDFIGATLFPMGAYFPGFTVSAVVTGVIYGLCLHKKEINYKNVILAIMLNMIVVNVCMNTYWLQIITGKAFLILLPARLTKDLMMIPIEVVTIRYIAAYLNATPIFRKINNVI